LFLAPHWGPQDVYDLDHQFVGREVIFNDTTAYYVIPPTAKRVMARASPHR
jgi:hypothetical protein